MDRPSPHTDEDSLFGSPPPSPARGRSPSQEIVLDQAVPVIAALSTGVATKNVGTIALPGSHMSCAELPADLPALSLSLPRPPSSHRSPSTTSPTLTGTSPPTVSTTIPSTSASTRKRRAPKAKSLTPAPAPPPITLPGPHEPTPPNFLRSQSSLLGLAGLVGSVKPAQLHTHQPTPQHTLICGSTPTHPIVLDDEDAPHLRQQPCAQPQTSQRLTQLNPEALRTNILDSLSREKNVFPVLESLVKLLGGEPQSTPANHSPQPFARPYGHGVLNALSPPPSSINGSTTPTVPPPKRRKLKHVPAGAIDWDVPFPFAAGEGPEGYRDTWARHRAKQLVTQLLELVQSASKRAAFKTATRRGKSSEGRNRAQNRQSSRSVSVETQIRQTSSTRASTREPRSDPGLEVTRTTATQSNVTPEDSLRHFFDSFGVPNAIDSLVPGAKDAMPVDLEGAAEEGSSAACDYSAFEEWLSQLQQLVPLEANAPTPESDWGTPAPLASPASGLAPAPTQCDALSASLQDEAIDPALLAISQLGRLVPQLQSPTSPTPTLPPGDILQVPSTSTSTFTHSPRISLSPVTGPLTALSEVTDALATITQQNLDCGVPVDNPVPKGPRTRKPFESPCNTMVQNGQVRADDMSIATTPSTLSDASQGVLDKHTALERARQLVLEIERAQNESWETNTKNTLLVHLTREG